MSGVNCERHLFDPAHERCRACGAAFCETCLVYTHGPKRPPFCIPCALVAGGVKQGGRSHRRRGLFGRQGPELVPVGPAPSRPVETPRPVQVDEAPSPASRPVVEDDRPTVIPGLRVSW